MSRTHFAALGANAVPAAAAYGGQMKLPRSGAVPYDFGADHIEESWDEPVAKCAGVTKAGKACDAYPMQGSEFCVFHQPKPNEQ